MELGREMVRNEWQPCLFGHYKLHEYCEDINSIKMENVEYIF